MTPSTATIDNTGSGTVSLDNAHAETLYLGDDDLAQSGLSNRSGIRIQVTENTGGLICRLSTQTDGVTTAYLLDDSGTVLDEQAIRSLEADETFTFDIELEADEAYWVLCDAGGQSYTRGRATISYPIESETLVATHGIYTGGGTRTNSYRYCIDRITPVGANATLDLGSDDHTQPGQSNRSGVRIQPTEDMNGVACRLSMQTEGVTTAYLYDDSGIVLERQTIAMLAPGDVFAFESELEADTAYWILCDASGRSYTRGRAAVDYPIESESLVATHGIYTDGGTRTSNYRYCIDHIIPGKIYSEISETLDLKSDELAQSGQSNRSGVRIQTTENVYGLTCRLSRETEGVTTAYLTDDSGTVLNQQPVDSLEAGETFTFNSRLWTNETYWVLCDAEGQTYTRGRAAVDYPLESRGLVATHGIYIGSGAQTDSYRYCIDRIQPATANLKIGTTLVLENDDQAQPSQSSQSGIRIQTAEATDGLECRLSSETEGVTTAYLINDSGMVLERQTLVTLDPGETFTFDTSLEADTAYWLLCDARGRNYTRGRAAVDYPLESDSLVATHGIYTGGGTQTSSYRYCFDRIRPVNNAAGATETLDLGSDEIAQSWSSLTDRSGVRIQAIADIVDLECRLSAETDGVTTAYLTDDTGTVLEQQAIDSLESGETFEFNTDLEGGEAYRILCDADGQRYVRGRAGAEYPLESGLLEATHGIYSGTFQTESYRYCIDHIRATSANRGLLASLENRSSNVTTVDVTAHPSINEDGDLAAELLEYLENQDVVNHEIILPLGSYNWNTTFSITDPIEFLAIRGDPRATLKIRSHDVSVAFQLGTWADDTPPQHAVLQHLDVDISDDIERDAGLVNAHVGRYLIDNIDLVGQRNLHGSYPGNRYTFLVNTRDEDAISVIRNVNGVDGEIEDPDKPLVGNHTIGFSADPPHQGVNVWKQCHVEDFVSSGYYLRNSPGENILDRSTAINCGNSGIRLGAADAARDSSVIYDDMSDRAYAGAGLWFNDDQPIAERIVIDGPDAQNDMVRVNSDADGGHIRNLSVFCGPTVAAPTVRCTQTSSTNTLGVLIEDFEIEDVTTASSSPSVIIRRPDVTFRSGVIAVENRPAIGGNEQPVLEDIIIK